MRVTAKHIELDEKKKDLYNVEEYNEFDIDFDPDDIQIITSCSIPEYPNYSTIYTRSNMKFDINVPFPDISGLKQQLVALKQFEITPVEVLSYKDYDVFLEIPKGIGTKELFYIQEDFKKGILTKDCYRIIYRNPIKQWFANKLK
jgi:hypothetical protein